MSTHLSPGDLVIVVKSRVGNEGKIGTVIGEAPMDGDGTFPTRYGPRVWVQFPRPIPTNKTLINPAPIPVTWLRRIPRDPLSEDDQIEIKERA